jgi:RNA polymerase sigma-70 factor (ECF subfamily)
MSVTPGEHMRGDEIGIEHADGLYGYAVTLTRNYAEAEDLVQETFVRALGAMHRLHENSNIKGWLFTILRNLWLNELRRRRNAPQIINLEDKDGKVLELHGNFKDSHDILVAREDAEIVRSAIAELPVEHREVILLREFEEMSYQEIATILNCPIGTVMSRLGRARARLRSILEGLTVPFSPDPERSA